MKNYELVIVLDGKATAAKKKAVIEKVEKLVKDVKGKVGKIKDWGVKELEYEINKSSSGVFLIFPLELTGSSVNDFSGKLKLEEDIIRYLVVRK